MTKYKLIYFDVRGRGEIPRLLFHAAGVPFEDKRLAIDSLGNCTEWMQLKSSRGEIPRLLFHAAKEEFEDVRIDNEEEWFTKLKYQMPQKVLPVLEVDGKRISQSLTICRFLAKEFGLLGKTNWEQALVEQVVDTMDDLRAEVAKWIHAKDLEKKDEIAAQLQSEFYPKFIGILEDILRENEENNNRSGYFVGDTLTLADLSVFETFTFPLSVHPGILDDHHELLEHRSRIESHKNLAEYIKTRPVRPV